MTPLDSPSPVPHSEYVAESADGTALPAGFLATPARQARWELPRAHWAPRVTVVRDASGAPVSAALTAGRLYSPSRKIIDVLVAPGSDADGAAFTAAIEAAALDAPATSEARPSPVLIRFEEHPALAPLSATQPQLRPSDSDAMPTPCHRLTALARTLLRACAPGPGGPHAPNPTDWLRTTDRRPT